MKKIFLSPVIRKKIPASRKSTLARHRNQKKNIKNKCSEPTLLFFSVMLVPLLFNMSRLLQIGFNLINFDYYT